MGNRAVTNEERRISAVGPSRQRPKTLTASELDHTATQANTVFHMPPSRIDDLLLPMAIIRIRIHCHRRVMMLLPHPAVAAICRLESILLLNTPRPLDLISRLLSQTGTLCLLRDLTRKVTLQAT
jgi:hypothetical protein